MVIAFVVAAAVLGQAKEASLEPITLGSFKQMLTNAGYTVLGEPSVAQFRVRKPNSAYVRDFNLGCMRDDSHPLEDAIVESIRVQVEMDVPNMVDAVAPYPLSAAKGTVPSVMATTHIPNTISVCWELFPMSKVKPESLIETVGNVWTEVDQYAKNLHAKLYLKQFGVADTFDASRMAGCEKRLFSFPDEESLRHLIAYWEWDKTAGFSGSAGGWVVSMRLDGREAWLMGWSTKEAKDRRSFSILTRVRIRTDNSEAWITRNASRYPWASFNDEGSGTFMVTGDIELARSTTVANVKQQILTFVSRVEAIEKGNRLR